MTTRQCLLVSMVCVVTIAFGCTRGGPDASAERQAGAARPAYGYAPIANSAVRYQPDVRVIPGGSEAVRSVSENGLTWKIDARAEGARELSVGHVMFATSRAVGRVISIVPVGDELAVTLAPVALTEIVRDATIDLTHDISPDSLVYEMEPDLPAMVAGSPAARDHRALTGTYLPAVARGLSVGPWQRGIGPMFVTASQSGGYLPDAVKGSGKVTVGNYEVEVYGKSEQKTGQLKERIGLKVQRRLAGSEGKNGDWDLNDALKAGFDMGLWAQKLQLRTMVVVRDGQLASSTFLIYGIEELDIDIWSGVQNVIENGKVRVEVPIKRTIEFPPGPETGYIPLVFEAKFKFLLEFAFGAKHSNLTANGRYQLSGPIGLDNGTVSAPAVSVKEPLLGSLGGVSPGVTGIVAAFELRLLTGVGTSVAMAGPYTKLVTAVGLTRGSALAAPAPACKAETLKIDVGAGFGVQMSRSVSGALQKILGSKVKFEFEVPEVLATPFNKTRVDPDVPACRLGQ